MNVTSVNLGESKTINWKGKEVQTGIYKTPVKDAIQLTKFGVTGDKVVDTKVHGGIDKSCYLYSTDHYEYWKELYSDLDWDWGMFGENITVEGLDEKNINIGDIYEIGEAHVQVSQPRQPCFKLGIKFGDQKILKDFIASGMSGIYMRVIKDGLVKKGDSMELLIRSKTSSPISDVFHLLYAKEAKKEAIENVIYDGNLAQSIREQLAAKI